MTGSYRPEGRPPGESVPPRDPLVTGPPTTPQVEERMGGPVGETAESGGTGGQVQRKAQEAAGQAQEKAQQVAGQVQEKAQQVAGPARDRVREQLNERSTQAGSQVRETADAIRRTGQQLRDDGKETQAKAAEQVADRAERLGSYLADADADTILRDVEDFGRRRPWLAAGIGAAAGFAGSRFLKASSSRRYAESQGSKTEPETPRAGGEYAATAYETRPSAEPAYEVGPTPTAAGVPSTPGPGDPSRPGGV